ncbi:MAG TPA: hypothetical protein VFY12_14070, partial [Arenimonas sp.]|nr:hypothetical protein [Arenimonas sp.]
MKTPTLPASLLATAVLLAACSQQPAAPTAEAPQAAAAAETAETPAVDTAMQPVDAFMDRIRSHCGQAFAGRIVADEPPPEGDDPFTGKALVMHVRGCEVDELRIPFHVGEDRSRTWILTRTEAGLRLKHDHRHEDGTPDATTMYGGDTAAPGSEVRQEFPVDAESIALFEAEGRT